MIKFKSRVQLAVMAVTAIVAGSISLTAVEAKTFKWAGVTDPQTLDPHATNSAPVLGFLNNVYEGLVRRNKQMKIEPALAEKWEPIGTEGWRFFLRKGVKFHDGAEFDSEDVLFSYQRASSEDSDVRSWFAPVKDVKIVDSHTIDFFTKRPNPLFPDSIANFMILDKGWAEKNKSEKPSREKENTATRTANGSGAFKVVLRDPGVKTELVPHDGWWDKAEHNITRAIFTPIKNKATGLAALLSGEIDFIEPIPLQDVPRLKNRSGIKVHQGVEARVLMLGFGHKFDKLNFSEETKDKNPLRDVQVRQAIYHAVNVDALVDKIMRGNAQEASQLVSPAMRGFSEGLKARMAFDTNKSKDLLKKAGYPNGFSLGLKCPNNRYINDEAICKAASSMLAKVGIKANLTAMPVRAYWPELRKGAFDMYLLGWSPGTFDAEHPIRFLASTPNKEKKLGSWNFGGYSNARIDALLPEIQTELDDSKRQAMIDEVHKIIQDDVAYVPLYVQPLVWGSKDNISLTQRTDNFFILRWVNIN